jgi:hypothetical protein
MNILKFFAVAVPLIFPASVWASIPTQPELSAIDCSQNPTHPLCMGQREWHVQLRQQDYDRLKNLRKKYGRTLLSQAIQLDFGKPEWQKTSAEKLQEQLKLQQLFQTQTKYSQAEIDQLVESIVNTRVAVETQDQLDRRFGIGGVKLQPTID